MDATEVCQGPKYGPQVRVVFIAPGGLHKNYGIEPSSEPRANKAPTNKSQGTFDLLAHRRIPPFASPVSNGMSALGNRTSGPWVRLVPDLTEAALLAIAAFEPDCE